MLGHVLMDHPMLKDISTEFRDAGHTNIPCDTVYSTIEKAARAKRIFTPSDWISTI